MGCRTLQLPGGGYAIACGVRERKCFTCSATRASLSCDGCDHVLCTMCAVTPGQGLDFCPRCFAPAFERWKTLEPVPQSRPERRNAFRLWARANAAVFLSLSKARTKTSLEEVP